MRRTAMIGSLKLVTSQGKVREKPGNFEMENEWQP